MTGKRRGPLPPGMQRTPGGLVIPIPTREEFFAVLDKVIKQPTSATPEAEPRPSGEAAR